MFGDVVFLLDVDNTLLDNDRVSADLKAYLDNRFGRESGDLYWAILNHALMNEYQQSVDEVLTALHTTRTGLTEEEAQARLKRYGTNALAPRSLCPVGESFSPSFRMCWSFSSWSRRQSRSDCGSMNVIRRCLTKRWRYWQSCSQCRHGLHSGIAGGIGRCRIAADGGGASERDPGRRTAERSRRGSCPATLSSSKKATRFPPMRV